MIRSPLYHVALLTAAVCSLSPGHAAEATGDNDEKIVVPGKVDSPGSRLAVPDIAPASGEAERARKLMKVPAGLEIKLWAAEPMLANPVAFNFDEKGRIFVAETYRYATSVINVNAFPQIREDDLACRTIEDRAALVQRFFSPADQRELSIESEVVRLLADTTGAGVADQSYIYADGFNSPLEGIAAGVLARRGKVWFTSIPSVWQFSGDTKAETRTEISRGYGVRFHYVAHDLHGLVWGPDGKLYFSNGDRGATVKTQEGGVLAAPDTGAVFRCNPDGSQMELVMTGLRNPQSLVFNEFGDLFTADNNADQGDEDRLMHIVESGDGGWRVGYQFPPLGRGGNPWLTERLWEQRHKGQAAYLLPPICNIENGPSGITYYPGTGLNPSYLGHLFITQFKGALPRSGIDTYVMKPKGASYEITDAKRFLGNALPTDAKFGPDGRLYFTDWVEGWLKSKRGRIYAISDPKTEKNPLTLETKALIGGDWTRRSLDELAKLLGHADWRVRLEAQFTLAERGAASIPALAKVATTPSSSAFARRHALWGLGQLARLNPDALEPVRTLVADKDGEVRAQALKVLGSYRNARDSEKLTAGLKDENNRVKFFAAQGLAKLNQADVASALLDALRANDDRDHFLRHALVTALAARSNLEPLTGAINDASRAVRLGVLLALRRLQNPAIAKFLVDADPMLVREAALAINDEPINDALPALAALLQQNPSDVPAGLRAINAHFRLGQPANAAALAAYAARAEAPAKLRAEALVQLALWPNPPQRDRLVGVYRPHAAKIRDRDLAVQFLQPVLAGLLANAPAEVQIAAIAAMHDLKIAGASEALLAIVKNDTVAGEIRAHALSTLDTLKDSHLAEALALAGASSSPELRLAALPIASRLSPATVAPLLRALAESGSITEQQTALRLLGRLSHPSVDPLLAQLMRAFIDGKSAPAAQLELITAARRRDDPAVKALVAEYEAAIAASPDSIAAHRIALFGGNARRGELIFEQQPTLACARCHRAGGDGGEVGPNLAGIGARNSREYLLESIVKPNAKIAPGFDTVVITLKSGAAIAGVLASENSSILALRNTDNKLVEIKKSDIAKRDSAPSGMPEIYGTLLTPSELRDVVEFLASLTQTKMRDRIPKGILRDMADYVSELKNSVPLFEKNKLRALRGTPTAQTITR